MDELDIPSDPRVHRDDRRHRRRPVRLQGVRRPVRLRRRTTSSTRSRTSSPSASSTRWPPAARSSSPDGPDANRHRGVRRRGLPVHPRRAAPLRAAPGATPGAGRRAALGAGLAPGARERRAARSGARGRGGRRAARPGGARAVRRLPSRPVPGHLAAGHGPGGRGLRARACSWASRSAWRCATAVRAGSRHRRSGGARRRWPIATGSGFDRDDLQVLADWTEGKRRGVIGSPHYFTPAAGSSARRSRSPTPTRACRSHSMRTASTSSSLWRSHDGVVLLSG